METKCPEKDKKIIWFILFLSLAFFQPAAAGKTSVTEEKEKTVYITKTGEKYHRSGCRSVSKSKIEIALKEAKARGYAACKVCNP